MGDEERKGLKAAAVAVVENGVGLALGTVGGLMVGPIAAATLPLAAVALPPLIKGHISQRTEARARAYQDALVHALMKSDLTFEEFASLDEERTETVFQAYRRAVDAHDPAVVPALGRLTAMALREGKDRFFVAAGRMLEQMTGPEFHELVVVVQQAATVPNEEERRVEFVRLHYDKTSVAALLEGRAITGDPVDGPTWLLDADLDEALAALSRFGLGRPASDDRRAGTFGAPHYLVSLEWATLTRLAQLFE